MKIKNSTYKLDSTQFDQSLAILRKEQQVYKPSRWQNVSYILFNFSVYGFVIGFILFLFVGIITDFPEQGMWYIVLLFLLVSWTIFGVLMPITFFLNVPLMRKIWHQIKLIRKLGLSKVFKTQWQAARRKVLILHILTLIVAFLGLLIIGGALILGITIVPQMGFSGGSELLLSWLIILILIIIGIAPISLHFMRRSKRRLEVVARLQVSLVDYKDAIDQAEDEQINIPSAEYEQIAQIERAQIYRDREESILDSFEEIDSSYYSVQKSRPVRKALAQLDPVARLGVEDQIDELTVDPQPPAALKDPEAEIWQLHVKDTPIEISFIIDEDNRRIKIFSLQLIADSTPSDSELGG